MYSRQHNTNINKQHITHNIKKTQRNFSLAYSVLEKIYIRQILFKNYLYLKGDWGGLSVLNKKKPF